MNDSIPLNEAFKRGARVLLQMAQQWGGPMGRVLPNPPIWLVQEVQQRLILCFNHVLQQESEAMSRLQRHAGQHIAVTWRDWRLQVKITPAGLLELDLSANAKPDLTVQVVQPSALEVAQTVLKGGQPEVRIDGDVQLAAQVNWLTQYVRWDVEEDLSRIVGDAPAHQIVKVAKQVAGGLKSFVDRAAASPASTAASAQSPSATSSQPQTHTSVAESR